MSDPVDTDETPVPAGVLIHLAGDQITMGDVSRQRCLWCGALIDEKDYTRLAITVPEGKTAEEAFEEFRQVRWTGFVAVDSTAGVTMRYQIKDTDPDGRPPKGSCLLLDGEVTA